MNALFAYLLLALIISFICSLVEAVFLSISRSYLNSIKDQSPWAISFLNFKKTSLFELRSLSLSTISSKVLQKLYKDEHLFKIFLDRKKLAQ